MAPLKDIGVRNYCDLVYNQLSAMKSTMLGFITDIEQMTGPEKEMLKSHIPHFRDIVNTIDWKLEIFMKICPFDWAGYATDVESVASVHLEEELPEKELISGGYIGG